MAFEDDKLFEKINKRFQSSKEKEQECENELSFDEALKAAKAAKRDLYMSYQRFDQNMIDYLKSEHAMAI